MKYELCEDGFWYDTVDCESLEEALDIARNNVDRTNYNTDDNDVLYIDVSARLVENHDECDSDTVILNPEEPDCTDSNGHDWQSPFEIVGGIKENPGVWGKGGGVIINECCMNCGCKRTTDTWAQRMDTGEQGFTEVTYEQNYYNIDVD